MKRRFATAISMILPALCCAQTAPVGAGHWEGAIVGGPGQELRIEIDLAKNDKQVWRGVISVPEQHLSDYPLADIVIEVSTVKFAMKGIPGDPTFAGKQAADGKTIAGQWTQGGNTMTCNLTRTGDAKVRPRPPIAKEFQGQWQGTLDANGTKLRLLFKLVNQADGTGSATLTSLDQGPQEIPVTAITQNGSELKLEVGPIAGTYTGELNKDGTEIAGQWSQGPGTFPLNLKRAAK